MEMETAADVQLSETEEEVLSAAVAAARGNPHGTVYTLHNCKLPLETCTDALSRLAEAGYIRRCGSDVRVTDDGRKYRNRAGAAWRPTLLAVFRGQTHLMSATDVAYTVAIDNWDRLTHEIAMLRAEGYLEASTARPNAYAITAKGLYYLEMEA
jgi:predicted transcriptional regulator